MKGVTPHVRVCVMPHKTLQLLGLWKFTIHNLSPDFNLTMKALLKLGQKKFRGVT